MCAFVFLICSSLPQYNSFMETQCDKRIYEKKKKKVTGCDANCLQSQAQKVMMMSMSHGLLVDSHINSL